MQAQTHRYDNRQAHTHTHAHTRRELLAGGQHRATERAGAMAGVVARTRLLLRSPLSSTSALAGKPRSTVSPAGAASSRRTPSQRDSEVRGPSAGSLSVQAVRSSLYCDTARGQLCPSPSHTALLPHRTHHLSTPLRRAAHPATGSKCCRCCRALRSAGTAARLPAPPPQPPAPALARVRQAD